MYMRCVPRFFADAQNDRKNIQKDKEDDRDDRKGLGWKGGAIGMEEEMSEGEL